MKLRGNVLIDRLYGPAGSVRTLLDRYGWGTLARRRSLLRKECKKKTSPPTNAMHKLADWTYTNMPEWWRPHWKLAVQAPHFTSYDLWMSECLWAFNRRAYAPVVPSASGGFTPRDVISGTAVAPPVEAAPWPAQRSTGRVTGWFPRPTGPEASLFVESALAGGSGVPGGRYVFHVRAGWCAVHQVFEVDQDVEINPRYTEWFSLPAGPCYATYSLDAIYTLRDHTTDHTFGGLLWTSYELPTEWPDPGRVTGGQQLMANPYGTGLAQARRSLGNWTPTVSIHATGTIPLSGLGWTVLKVTTASPERLARVGRTLAFGAGGYMGQGPEAPSVWVRITENDQLVGPLYHPGNSYVRYYCTGNLDGLAFSGSSDLLRPWVLDYRSHVLRRV